MTTLKQPKQWVGEAPDKCDIGGEAIKDIFIDGRTDLGAWAFMCPDCHKEHGFSLGTGKGQKYEKRGEIWLKTEG